MPRKLATLRMHTVPAAWCTLCHQACESGIRCEIEPTRMPGYIIICHDCAELLGDLAHEEGMRERPLYGVTRGDYAARDANITHARGL